MDIAIIGAGNVGSALARAWCRAGRRVVVGVRAPDNAKYDTLREEDISVAAISAAVASAPVVVIATPWPDTVALVASLDLTGKTVMDATNPVGFGSAGLEVLATKNGSAAEDVAEAAPGAFVFKTLNQAGADILGDAGGAASPSLMLVAGDDAARKQDVIALVPELGFDVRDTGPLSMARHLESLAVLWITQAFMGPLGRDYALAAVKWSPSVK